MNSYLHGCLIGSFLLFHHDIQSAIIFCAVVALNRSHTTMHTHNTSSNTPKHYSDIGFSVYIRFRWCFVVALHSFLHTEYGIVVYNIKFIEQTHIHNGYSFRERRRPLSVWFFSSSLFLLFSCYMANMSNIYMCVCEHPLKLPKWMRSMRWKGHWIDPENNNRFFNSQFY